MKSQTQHIGNYSNVFDYSPFGVPLDGRTIENIFHQEEITDTSTVVKTIYVLEETFDVASDWQAINSHTEITYPSGRMRVRNSASTKKTIGAEKDFTTGTGQHTVSFDVVLPIFSCTGAIIGTSSTDSQNNEFNTTDTLVGVSSYQILSYSSDFYAVVEIRDENNSIVLKDSTNMTATHSYTFSAPQGKEYNISLYSNRFCPTMGFHFDNVFISYDTLEVVTGNTIIVSDTLFIINNDFENPIIEPNGAGVKIDGWTHYSPSTTLSVESHNGSDWLKVVSTVGSHGAHQGFSVEPGETYTFEIDLHRPAGMNNEINIVIWKNTGPSGALSIHVLNTDGFNTFNYTATSSNIYIQIRQAGIYYLDNIRMYRTYEDTIFVSGYEVDMAYRYGYNTQERVDEVSGKGNHYTAEFWEYSPRIGRRWNVDPVYKHHLSNYSVMSGNPISRIDPNGDNDGIYIDEETGEVLGEDEFGADDGLVHYTSKENWDKYANSPYANKSEFLKKDGGISLTIDVFDEITKKLHGMTLPEFSEEMTLTTNLFTNIISGLAENTANTKFKYPDPKPLSDAAKNSFKNLAKAAQNFALLYTVTDKSVIIYNAYNHGDVSKVTQEAVVLTGYIVSSIMMSTPSPFGVTQVAGALVFIGTTAYDLFTD